MANQRGYSRYQYETSPRKLRPEYEPPKEPYKKKKSTAKKPTEVEKQKAKTKTKKKLLKNPKTKMIAYIGIAFVILFAISYRNSQINEKFTEVQSLKKNLATVQKENEQLKVNIENSLNLNHIEQSAKEMLGMQKLNNKQTVYVSLPKKDYVEPSSEKVQIETKENWFQKVMNQIKGEN